MRVLMLHPHDIRYHPWTIRIVKLAECLAEQGHDIHVCCVAHKHADQMDLPTLRDIPEGKVKYTLLRPRDKQTHRNITDVINLAKDYDLIHFQKCFPSTFIPAVWAAWRWKKPLHYDWDDNETLILQEIKSLPPGFFTQASFFEKRIPYYVDTISVASDRLGEICQEMGFPAERIVKVPVGADLNDFGDRGNAAIIRREAPYAIGDRPLVAYIGQIEGASYATLFVEACKLLVGDFPDVCWMVVGGGAMLSRLEELVFNLDLSSRVVLTDYLPSAEIPNILAAADIAVACFSDEEFVACKSPLKMAEYLAAGKAIVASAVGEVPWMAGDSAVLVQPGDASALAEGIRKLLSNPQLRRELGLKARARAEQSLNWRQSALNLAKAYEIALQQN